MGSNVQLKAGGARAFGQADLMRFRILGPLEVLSTEGWTAIGAPKWRSLLACLLVRPGQLVPTDVLIDEIWGESPPHTANNLVSIYVHRLRKVINDAEGRVLVYRAPGYLLRLSPSDLDMQEFESRVADGRAALAEGDPRKAAALLGDALELWRGPLLADVPLSPLLVTQVNRAAEQRLAVTELRIDADLACGRAAQVVAELRGLVSEHPLRERLWALLIRALEEAGRRAEALEMYAKAREVIADELGVDPGSELQRLYANLLASDASPPPSAPPVARPRQGRAREPAAPVAAAAARPDAEAAAEPGPGVADAEEPSPEPPGTIAIGTFLGPAEEEAEAEPQMPEKAAGVLPSLPRPAQLPADIGDFTGRETHVRQLSSLLLAGNAESSPGAVRIVVVNGAAGLGKTTLAVHAAHQVRAQFPEGQLYVDLQGASSQTAPPGEVLARFLRDLGVEGDKIPARDDERAALYRTTLVGHRVLILLDNAKDAAQVRPLLPGTSSCAVLVTTRNRSADLASTRFVDLNVLEDTEALALFSRIVGEERAAAEPDATAEILVACAGLPLAIRICAARLAKRRQWRISTLADRLRNQHRRLDELTTGDLAVRASFQVSYDSLGKVGRGADPARVFRLLGLWQGATISLYAATALLGAAENEVADALETLVDINLLESPAPDRYSFHDLLRAYATERAEAEEPQAVRAEAVSRLLYWYLSTSEVAMDVVSPRRYRVLRDSVAFGYPQPDFTGPDDALAWYEDERANIVSAIRQAAAAGMHDVASRMPPTLYPVFNRRSNWADCVITQRIAVESARKANDRLGEAWALFVLGFALARLRDDEAFGHLEQALAIRREHGDTHGEAQTAVALGEAHLNMDGPGEAALRSMRRAVELLRPDGATALLGVALNNLGEVYYQLGDLSRAAECYDEARDISEQIGGHALGHALHNLGRVYLDLDRLDDASIRITEALRVHRASGDLFGEAMALRNLGWLHRKKNDIAAARSMWITAQTILQQLGEVDEAADVTAALGSL